MTVSEIYDRARREDGGLPPLVAQAVQHIHEGYSGLYGVEELSEELGVSKCHLVRAFSHGVGMPPGKYLTAVRVAAAERLLSAYDLSVEAVSGLCGFSGANYLCRVFRRETGLTPAAYRRQHGGTHRTQDDREQVDRLYL